MGTLKDQRSARRGRQTANRRNGQSAAVDAHVRPRDFLSLGEIERLIAGAKASRSYARIWVTRLDQAARVSVSRAATPSVNVTPSMTCGNWFAPFRRRHVFAAA